MPRFYFDVREDGEFSADDEGVECANLDAAERMAAESAASIARDELPTGHAREVSIEVRNEQGEHLLAVTIAMKMERRLPALA